MASRKIVGNFDPIHYGHLLLGEAAREQYGLDRVIFIPEKLAHLMKGSTLSPGDIRYNMVKMAIKDNPYFTCSRIEIDKPKGTYTYDTLEYYLFSLYQIILNILMLYIVYHTIHNKKLFLCQMNKLLHHIFFFYL